MRSELKGKEQKTGRSRLENGTKLAPSHWSAILLLVFAVLLTLRWTTDNAQAEGDPVLRLKALVSRNAFNLNPPKTNAPPKEEEPPPAEVGELFLTGFSTMVSPASVYLMSVKDGTNSYYTLSEGQSQKGIEALDIDTDLKKVKIRRDGKLMTLNFKDHGRKNSQSRKGSAARGNAAKTAANRGGSSTRGRSTTTRGGVTPTVASSGRNNSGGRGTVAGVNSGAYNSGSRNANGISRGNAQVVSRGRNSNPAAVDLRPAGISTAEEQRILMETYNALRDPGSPPLPGVSQPAPQNGQGSQDVIIYDDGY